MKLYSEREKNQLLDNYFNLYGDAYKDNDIDNIRREFLRSYLDHLTQIYSALEMFDDEENPYVGFTKLIEKVFGLDINILEVGGGIYPALSKEIAKRQASIGKGSITVMDPLLSCKVSDSNIKLLRKEFKSSDKISHFDLIIGKEPCYATETIIESGIRAKKPIVLSPCKCYGFLPEWCDYGDNPVTDWFRYVKNCMTDTTCEVYTTKLNDMHYDNPIYTRILK